MRSRDCRESAFHDANSCLRWMRFVYARLEISPRGESGGDGPEQSAPVSLGNVGSNTRRFVLFRATSSPSGLRVSAEVRPTARRLQPEAHRHRYPSGVRCELRPVCGTGRRAHRLPSQRDRVWPDEIVAISAAPAGIPHQSCPGENCGPDLIRFKGLLVRLIESVALMVK